MRKIIAAINMTLDGYGDHTGMVADEAIHKHYAELLMNAGAELYGRITYQLMESYWPAIVKNPTGVKSTDEFAVAIDKVPKIVFSHTLKNIEWETASLAKGELKEVVLALRQQAGKDIFVGSRSLIVSLLNLNLIDELQLCVHPVILGNGSIPLLNNITDRIELKLLKTKTFSGGAIILYYEPVQKDQ